MLSASQQTPLIITDSKTKPFWKEKDFYRDKNPLPIEEFVHRYLKMYPSPRQLELLYALAGKDPYEWDTKYQQYVIVVGQGGGKNRYIISPYIVYCAYKIGNMVDAWRYFSRYFDQPLDTIRRFEMSNSSMKSARQAKNVHFENVKEMIKRTKTEAGDNWFEKYLGMDLEESFGDITAQTIEVPLQKDCGNVKLHSFDSTYGSFEGIELIIAIIDEASRADTKPKYENVEMLWKGIIGNINTRYPRRVGKAIVFSYLNNSEYDYTNTLLTMAEEERKHCEITGEQPTIFSINLSTFDTNPTLTKEDPDIRSAYRTDPKDAMARYEGIKGIAKEGFYQPHPEKIKECFFPMTSPVDYVLKITERSVRDPSTGEEKLLKHIGVALDAIRGDGKIRGIAFDPAVSYDGFILKCGYIETMDELKENLFFDNRRELVTVNKRPVIDIVIVWQPQADIPVDYLSVGEVIGELLTAFPNIRFAVSDKYNSEKLKQEIQAKGVFAQSYGFGNAQQMKLYKTLRWLFFNNVPQILLDEKHVITKKGSRKTAGAWNLLEHQRLLRINDNKVDHPAQGGKDFSDVDALLVNELIKLEVNDMSLGTGLNAITDQKIINYAEKYLIIRAKLRKEEIKENHPLFMKRMVEEFHLPLDYVKTIRSYTESQFSDLMH